MVLFKTGTIGHWTILDEKKVNLFGDDKKGYVKVFEFNDSVWVQKGQTITGEAAGDEFGYATSLSDDGNVVGGGAVYSNFGVNGAQCDSCGSARVFEFNGSTWVQKGGTLSGYTSSDKFGWVMRFSSDGSIVAVSAVSGSTDGKTENGYISVFQYDNSDWVQMGNNIRGDASGVLMGYGLDLSANGLTLAATTRRSNYYGTEQVGRVRVYDYVAGDWIKNSVEFFGENSNSQLGPVSLSSNSETLAVAQPYNPPRTRVFNRNVSTFDASNTLTSYVALGCGARGSEANADLSQCKSGYSLVEEASQLSTGCAAESNDGCCYLSYKVYECDTTLMPSDTPSLAPSFPTWSIANATYIDHLDQDSSYITMNHVIGTANSALEVTLYQYEDCETPVESDSAVSLANKDISGRTASYDVMLKRESVGSSVFLEGGDELQFCVGAGLHVPNDTNGWGSIVSKKTKISIAFNLANAQFTITEFDTQGENPDDSNTNIEADDNFYEMTACICSESFTCDSLNGVVAAQQENSVVNICLKPPTGLNFEGYNMIFSKGDVDVADSEFSYNAIGAPFTSEEKEGNMIRVRTQLLSGLFDVGATGEARVSGTGNFVFDTSAKDGKEDEVEGNYNMFVGLQEVEECQPGLIGMIQDLLGFNDI